MRELPPGVLVSRRQGSSARGSAEEGYLRQVAADRVGPKRLRGRSKRPSVVRPRSVNDLREKYAETDRRLPLRCSNFCEALAADRQMLCTDRGSVSDRQQSQLEPTI